MFCYDKHDYFDFVNATENDVIVTIEQSFDHFWIIETIRIEMSKTMIFGAKYSVWCFKRIDNDILIAIVYPTGIWQSEKMAYTMASRKVFVMYLSKSLIEKHKLRFVMMTADNNKCGIFFCVHQW